MNSDPRTNRKQKRPYSIVRRYLSRSANPSFSVPGSIVQRVSNPRTAPRITARKIQLGKSNGKIYHMEEYTLWKNRLGFLLNFFFIWKLIFEAFSFELIFSNIGNPAVRITILFRDPCGWAGAIWLLKWRFNLEHLEREPNTLILCMSLLLEIRRGKISIRYQIFPRVVLPPVRVFFFEFSRASYGPTVFLYVYFG